MRRFHLILLNCIFISSLALALEPKFLYEEDPTSLTTTVQVVVLTGTADDPSSKVGLTNLMGELMLRGTKKRTRSKFQSDLERLGANIGAVVTGDAIAFGGRVIKQNTAAFLSLIEDCLVQPAFSPKEFDLLKRELLDNAYYRKNQNLRLGGLAVRKQVFAGTSLELPGDGGVRSLEAIKLEDVVKAYNNHFHRGNFVFAIASPFKESELKKAVADIWLKFPDGARLSRHSISPQIPKSPTLIVINKPATASGSIMMAQAGITAQEPLRFALGLGNFGFGADPLVSRLFAVVRSQLGYTYQIGSTYHALGGLSNQQGLFVISTAPSMEFTAKTLLKVLSMWNEYLANGLTSDELKLAQDSLVNSYPFTFESADKRLGEKLHSYLYNVPVLSQDEYAKTIYGISNSDIKKAAHDKQTGEGWIISITADVKVIEKQLAEEQKTIPESKRLKISKVLTPDEVVQ